MITYGFLLAVGVAALIALNDWRTGWYAVIVIGVLQDPIRKLTPGAPVAMTLNVVIVYFAVIVAGWSALKHAKRDFGARFPNLFESMALVIAVIVFAAFNGLASYGFEYWKVPALSLVIYMLPIPAALFGYAFFDREEVIVRYLRFFAVVTSVSMVGTLLEYFRVQSPALGLVASEGDLLRHIAGINVRMLSGIYRAPDVMAWHAATLTCVGVIMALRAQLPHQVAIWLSVAAWGFANSLMSGRRKAMMYVLVFFATLLWRYFSRLRTFQIATLIAGGLIVGAMMQTMSSRQSDVRVYAQGVQASRAEVLARFEGGSMETIQQFGILGGGLGIATQGVQHLLPPGAVLGWQEGGLAKLFAEIGVPGVLGVALSAFMALSLLLKISGHPDVEGSSQLVRAGLFGLLAANAFNFVASAQAYSDPVLALLTALFVGGLFATVRFDEKAAPPEAAGSQNARGAAIPAARPLRPMTGGSS